MDRQENGPLHVEYELLADGGSIRASGPDLVGRNIAAAGQDGFRLLEAAKMDGQEICRMAFKPARQTIDRWNGNRL